MSQSLILGNFNAEVFWDNHVAALPSMEDKTRENIILAMDELLFSACEQGDLLLTRFPMDRILKNYLHNLGFEFEVPSIPLWELEEVAKRAKFDSIEVLLGEEKSIELWKSKLKGRVLNPYALHPETEKLCSKGGIKAELPAIEVVKWVNSKVYSTELVQKLGLKAYGHIITGIDQLKSVGKDLLEESSILVKEPMGVSGKGNLLIDKSTMLDRIAFYLQRQEEKGKKIELIMEPFLEKEIDFSCQFEISAAGDIKILSVQKMMNKGFGYLGTYTAEKDFIEFLQQNYYFETMHRIGKQLFKEGYFGDVCVDSMVLQNEEIVPIVEINARKSMGFINHYIEKYLRPKGLNSMMTFLSLGYEKGMNFEELFKSLKSSGLLYDGGVMEGILPMSSNTLFINSMLDQEKKQKGNYKGRFYASVVYQKRESTIELVEKLKEFFRNEGFTIYN